MVISVSEEAAFFWIAFDTASKFRWAFLISLILLFLLFVWITKIWLALAIPALVVTIFLVFYFWPPGGYGSRAGNNELDKTMIDATIEKSDTDDSVHSDYSISTDADGAEGDF